MSLVAGGLVGKLIAVTALLLVIAWLARSRIVRSLSLGPGVHTALRYRWLLPSRAARLHRRLQALVRACLDAAATIPAAPRRRWRRRQATVDPVAGAARSLLETVDEAVQLDKILFEAAGHRAGSPAHKRALASAAEGVTRLEETARRRIAALRHARAEYATVPPDDVLDAGSARADG